MKVPLSPTGDFLMLGGGGLSLELAAGSCRHHHPPNDDARGDGKASCLFDLEQEHKKLE
jgi:hypothetical protein